MEKSDNKEENDQGSSNLDSLLDDALEDFSKPVPPKSEKHLGDESPGNPNVWTDEFIASATKNFEATMRSILNQQNQENVELASENNDETPLDVGTMSAEFAKFAEAAAKAATDSASDDDFTKCLAETMQQVTKNKEDAQVPPSADELSKIFESFGLGEGDGAEGSEFGGLFPIMQTMLENILSKDVLYPPLKDLVNRFPDWLADNRTTLPEADYDRYNKQYDIMKQVVEKFESEREDDSKETKAQTSEAILLLMQRLQELGQPPKDLVGDFEPLVTVDEKGNPKLPDLASLLGGMGFPSLGNEAGEGVPPGELGDQQHQGPHSSSGMGTGDGSDQCTLM